MLVIFRSTFLSLIRGFAPRNKLALYYGNNDDSLAIGSYKYAALTDRSLI